MSLRVVHIITTLGTGGAESVLERLCVLNQANDIEQAVICLKEEDRYGDRLRSRNIKVSDLGMPNPFRALVGIWRMIFFVRDFSPNIIMGWMYHGIVVATLIRALFLKARTPLIWTIRHSFDGLERHRRNTRTMIRLGKLLSKNADLIIYNSTKSLGAHSDFGYAPKSTAVISNGFDVQTFEPNAEMREKVRKAWGAQPEEIFVGSLARYHTDKDYPNLIAAFAFAHAIDPKLRLVLAGLGLDRGNQDLKNLLVQYGIKNDAILMGKIAHPETYLPGLDIFCLSSSSDCFPNSVGEAMSCGVFCVSTNVGEVSRLLGDCGLLVPPKNPKLLSSALVSAANEIRASSSSKGRLARQRIETEFSVQKMCRDYNQRFREVAALCGAKSSL